MDYGKGMLVIGRGERMGLGTMTQDFCRAFMPDRVILIDRNGGRDLPDGSIIGGEVIKISQTEFSRHTGKYLEGMRVVVGFETWYEDRVVPMCRGVGIKTVMFPMWEWSPGSAQASDVLITLSETDAIHSFGLNEMAPPSIRTHQQILKGWWPPSPEVPNPGRQLNWPPQRFVHCAGNARHNRDGTREVLEAATYLVGTGVHIDVYAGFDVISTLFPDNLRLTLPCVQLHKPTETRRDIFDACDCLVFPRRLGGHSLPINEALGEGIPVITLDLPDWQYLPYRVKAHPQPRERFGRGFCDVAKADPHELGMLMRNMALGNVERKPGPILPPWTDFVEWWQSKVDPR